MSRKMDLALQKIAGMTSTGEEELARVQRVVLTREDTRAQTHELFENAQAAQKRDRAVVEKLFLQTPAAQTMAPNLQKTAAIDAFFDKLASSGMTEAQRRFPELLKVASSRPNGGGA